MRQGGQEAVGIAEINWLALVSSPQSKKPNLKGWAFCWVFLVPTAGFELAT